MGEWYKDATNYITTVYDEPFLKQKAGNSRLFTFTDLRDNPFVYLANVAAVVQEKDRELVNKAQYLTGFRRDQKNGVKFWKKNKAAYQKALAAAQEAAAKAEAEQAAEREAAAKAEADKKAAEEAKAAAAKAEAERLANLPVTEYDFEIRQNQQGTIDITSVLSETDCVIIAVDLGCDYELLKTKNTTKNSSQTYGSEYKRKNKTCQVFLVKIRKKNKKNIDVRI